MHTKQDHEMHLKFENTMGGVAHIKAHGTQFVVRYNEYEEEPFPDLLSSLVHVYESSKSNGVPYTLVSAQTAQTAHEPHHEEVKTPVHEHVYSEKKPSVAPVLEPEPHVREVSPVQEDEKKHATHAHKAPSRGGRAG